MLMKRRFQAYLMAAGSLAAVFAAVPATAQKPGGVLRMPIGNSPASMSIHEEATRIAVTPMMAVFNNLVLFDQQVAQNTFESIRPDLAESWSWDEDKTALTFRLRTGVKWHDGKPFTAQDVKCTWDTLAGRSSEKLRVNPRKSWYRNLAEVTVDGDNEVTFHLQRPQPSLLALLASGASPVYPCHVPPAEMRQHPIGTGPFKFVEFKSNESIKVTRNPDYWKPDRPYLDGIEYSIIPNVSTQMLAFSADQSIDLCYFQTKRSVRRLFAGQQAEQQNSCLRETPAQLFEITADAIRGKLRRSAVSQIVGADQQHRRFWRRAGEIAVLQPP